MGKATRDREMEPTSNRDEEKTQKGQQESTTQEPKPSADKPPAGPHAKPGLTNPKSTPGSGLLPDPDDPAESSDSTSS